MAELVFSQHSVSQMQARKISVDEVELVIAKFDGWLNQSFNKKLFYKRLRPRDDNLIAVVAVRSAFDAFEVITVMHFFEVRK
jgi:hypothetical protein